MAKFTLVDMERFATEAWGELGTHMVKKWAEFNEKYFRGKLRPVPLVITNTLPFGKRIAFCSYSPDTYGRTITINLPKAHTVLVADNNTLLDEMVHQMLFERGEPAGHDSEGWRRKIMRLTKMITGKQIWVGKSITKRVEGSDGKLGKVIRISKPHEDGRTSITQMEIARWPHDGMGIDLGRLGDVTPSFTARKVRARALAGDHIMKLYRAMIWKRGSDRLGQRTSVLAETLKEAKEKFEAGYGEGN